MESNYKPVKHGKFLLLREFYYELQSNGNEVQGVYVPRRWSSQQVLPEWKRRLLLQEHQR